MYMLRSMQTSRLPGKILACLLSSACCIPSALAEPAADALPVEAAGFATPGHVDVVRSGGANPVLDINHNVDKTVLNWQSFDIGRNGTVNFKQLNSSSLTLNRIGQGSASRIFGNLNANGRIFLINQNGIIFGEGSQINVGELTASTLNISDEVFEEGILSALQNQEAAFSLFTDAAGNPLPSEKITIEAGAELNAEPGGRIFILAPDIENNGIIRTPDGQTLLAAGEKVYLQASNDPGLRGILVEVDSGGEVLNLGEIVAERGNATLIGLTVNQGNRVSATTSVSANGSIRLLARDTAQITNTAGTISMDATNTGELNLGEDSVTEILAELKDTTKAIDDQVQFKSRVEMMGKKIHLKKNSLVSAKGGEVSISALDNPFQDEPVTADPIARNPDAVVQMETGSRIDVSGNSTTLEMSRNNITVELRGNELKDLPLQRDGTLRGESVVVDLRRVDDFQMGDISGNLGAVERNVAERTAEGGTVKINSEGDVRILRGAGIDVSGGTINYKDGEVRTTLLRAGNQLIDIHDADPERVYDGVFGTISTFESGYVEGRNAGSIEIAGHGIIADGDFSGHTTAGRYQRIESKRPQGGRLVIGLADGQGVLDFRAPNVTLQEKNLIESIGNYTIAVDDSYADAGIAAFQDQLLLSGDFLSSGGFTRAEINSNGNITLTRGPGLDLAPDSRMTLRGESVNILRDISSAGGDLEFVSTGINPSIDITASGKGVYIDDGVSLDVSGNWTNDFLQVSGTADPLSPVILDGGSITLVAGEQGTTLSLGDSVALLVLGGARRTAAGDLEYGGGGDITLSLGVLDGDTGFSSDGDNIAFETGRNNYWLGHAAGGGGRFTLNANAISIEDMSAAGWFAGQSVAAGETVRLADFYFSDSGFSEFIITSNQGDITVRPGAAINMQSSGLFLPTTALMKKSTTLAGLFSAANGGSVLPFREDNLSSGWLNNATGVIPWLNSAAYTGFMAEHQRSPQSLTLAITDNLGNQRKNLVLSEGAQITADPGAVLNLGNSAGGYLAVNGIIDAPAAEINLSLSRKADHAFAGSHAVVFGSNSRVNASGAMIPTPDPLGLKRGRVLDAGSVNVTSSGYIVTAEGAELDLSGVSASLDVTGGISSRVTSRKTIHGRAGSIRYAAAEGIIDGGNADLSAANPAGAAGGSISYEIDRTLRGGVNPGLVFPGSPVEMTLANDQTVQLGSGFKAGNDVMLAGEASAMLSTLNGKASISTRKLEDSGVDQLLVRNRSGTINLQDDLDLELRRDIVLDAPVLYSNGGRASLQANYVAIGASQRSSRNPAVDPDPLTGGGQLTVNANIIDLVGLTTLRGVGSVDLNSTGDIRFRGVSNQVSGEFAMVGDLDLTADQIYPATMSDFLLDAGDNGTITVHPGGAGSGVLSAAGQLTLHAGRITQQGIIRAPMGGIKLQAEDELLVDAGSITSVSADGLSILLGQTLNGTQWLYSASGSLANARTLYSASQQNMPEKTITLDSADISVAENAIVDLTGGGELVTWEFIPGPGGSVDALAAENADGFFAVLPGLGSDFAPFDAQEFNGWDLDVGESVYLSGGNGLTAGNYVKLPARYALLPGAFLIQAVDGFNHIPLGQQAALSNGTLVSGFTTINGSGGIRDSSTSGFIIRPGEFAGQLGEYEVNRADDLVTSIAEANDFSLPRLTEDAGALVIKGNSSVDLNGSLLTAAAAGARGALVDISADVLRIVDSKSLAPTGVEILAESLNGLGAESLLLGGIREFGAQGTELDVLSTSLVVESGVDLGGPEIILVARDNVNLKSGSSLTGSGSIDTVNAETLLLDGDSALVRVSAAPQVSIRRSNSNGTADLGVEPGVLLKADRSITLDSSGNLVSDATLDIQSGELGLGASKISIGDVPFSAGLVLDDTKLADIAGFDLSLRTDATIDFYGSAFIDVADLEFNASGLVASQTLAADVVINADTVVLGNPGDAPAPAGVTSPNGQLNINANELMLTDGEFFIGGFDTVTGNFGGDVSADGVSGLHLNGNLDLTAARLTASSGSALDVQATGYVNLRQAVSAPATEPATGIGATLNIGGGAVLLDTTVDMPVGEVNINSTDGDIVLGENANVDVSGYSINVRDLAEITLPGGNVSLIADNGNIDVQSGSTIDVGSGGDGNPAGSLQMLAIEGDVSLRGDVLSQFPIDADGQPALEQGGRLRIDASSIGQSDNAASRHSYRQLNDLLNAGGFTGARDIRLRNGDIDIETGNIMFAQDIKLTADDGSIRVAGALLTVDNDQGGTINLIAADDLTLDAGAFLSVAPLDGSVAGPGANGGEIRLQADSGLLDLNSGAFLQAGSGEAGTDGTVYLRAARTASNNEINIADLNAFVLGAEAINIEAVKVFDPVSTITTGVINTVQDDTAAFMANAGAIEARLGVNADPRYRLQPGVELRNDGDMTLAANWDVSSWRYNAQPGVLTLRSTGDLKIDNDLSDGIETVTETIGSGFFAQSIDVDKLTADSWSFRLVAGAGHDNGRFSTDPLATGASPANLVIGPDVTVRTGTGDIDAVASGDIRLQDINSVLYTLGRDSGLALDRRREDAVFSAFAPAGNRFVSKFLPEDGGDIRLRAGNDMIGPGSEFEGTQLITEWFKRQTPVAEQEGFGGLQTAAEDAGVWIDVNAFHQGIAAFGGGNIDARAGNDIVRLSLSAPTSMSSDFDSGEVTRIGEGNIRVQAQGDIEGGIFFVGDGMASIRSGGSIIGGRRDPSITNPQEMDTIFAVMGGGINVDATGDVVIDAIYNPTTVFNGDEPIFVTYSETSTASITSISGSIVIDPGFTDIQKHTLKSFSNTDGPFRTMPGQIRMAAIQGEISIKSGELDLFPVNNGSLELFARDTITVDSAIIMSDAPRSLVPGINNPVANVSTLNLMVDDLQHAEPPLHSNDRAPSWIVSTEGDIDGGIFFLPEAANLYAGRDIRDIRLSGQNLRATDITSVEAGRDIILTGNTDAIGLAGPGRLEVTAGRNIDLGPSVGIETRGNLLNGVLANDGADILVQAGVGEGAHYGTFFADYFGPDGDYRQSLLGFLDANPDLIPEGSPAFLALSPGQQWQAIGDEFKPELIDAFYAELIAAGRDSTGDFSRGFKAIDALYPESRFNRNEAYNELALKLPGESNQEYFNRLADMSDYQGDLSLFFSKVYTLDGGDINLLVPGGFVNAGLASAPANAPLKEAGELGVVAQAAGDIRTFSRGDFQVNQSRVSTLLGGDILMWSSVGNIDAGRGSKTAISAPEPQITITNSGEIQVDLSNTVSGSGIRAVVVDPSVTPGDVDLIAPNGIVDAGDAGIATSGNLNIAAIQVIGADNIQFGGVAVGVPGASTGSISTGSLSGVSNVASSASKVAESSAQQQTENPGDNDEGQSVQSQLTFISVEVLGFGEEEDEEDA